MSVPRHRRRCATLLVATFVAVLLPVGASATDTTGDSTALERALAASASLSSDATAEAAHRWQDRLCVSDPADDTFWMSPTEDGDERVYEPFPPADIREFCGDYADGLTVELRTAQPTNPQTHPSWIGETGAFWFLDATGDGQFDRVVVSAQDGDGELVAEVLELTDAGEDELACIAEPGFDVNRGMLTVTGIPADCIGEPDRVLIAPIMVFDEDPTDPNARIFLDVANHSAGVGRNGQPTLREASRLAGDTRFTTAVAISQARYPDDETAPPQLYLARADVFADALAASALASNPDTDGPILLVTRCGDVPEAVHDEIVRLDPETVTALGGQAAVCDETLAEAAMAGGADRGAARLASGREPTRFGTAVAISERAFPDGSATVYLATGLQFPDALAAGALDDGPVLLAPSCNPLPAVVTAEIERLDAQEVVALGGEGAVCDEVLEEARTVGDADRDAARLSGATRFETAVAITAAAFPEGATVTYLARADHFPDALAGGVLRDGPVLLVPRCGYLPGIVGDELRRLNSGQVVALGGEAAVCGQMLRHAANA